jgi:two-component system, NtrC family, sensor kinase
MKLFLKILLLFLLPAFVKSQNRKQMDSAYLILQHAANDTVRMGAYSMLGGFYDDINVDSGLYYCNKGIAIAEKLGLYLNKAEILAFMGWPLMKTGNYPEALKVISQGLEIAEDPSNEKKAGNLKKGQTAQMYQRSVIGLLYAALESLYLYVGNYEKQIAIAHEAIIRLEYAGDTFNLAGIYPDIGDSYLKLNKFDSALFYHQKSLYYYSKLPIDARKFEGSTYTSIGTIYEEMGNLDLAMENYQKAILVSEQHDNPRHTGNACLQLVNLYQSLKKSDSAFLYAKKALKAFTQGGYKKEVAIAYRMISDYYHDQNKTDSSFVYLRLAIVLDDSLDKIEKTKLQEFQVAAFNQQLALQQKEQERIEKEGNLKTIAILALIAVFSIIGFLLYRNNRQKQKANQTLHEKNTQIEQTLSNLKVTQSQLIQSEKMASLGELTAGIAHEIQNPLNFVNNFSEVNSELISELVEEVGKGNLDEVKAIAKDIKANEQKINHHGKRADAIVKGMLQHSRSSSGQKELTDINALCDEYLRLSYHGLRAKDKSFNATLKTDFDNSIGNINIIPQDIGRVVLNLINNAFYAVDEKKKSPQPFKGSDEGSTNIYEPVVTVSTKRLNSPSGDGGSIEIRVIDNGSGIPKNAVDKIFQPFFTTKPTGQGTGLGLSLSYDIVKAHAGELKVETKEGEGTTFIISLPVNSNV